MQNTDQTYGDWHSACRRVTTWMLLKDKKHGGSLVGFYSTHFDHRSQEAMKQSSQLLARQMKALDKADVLIAVGDLNTKLEDGLLQPLQEQFSYARTDAPGSDLYIGTFNGFGNANSIIDHIFYDGPVIPLRYWVDKADYGVPLLSDHYPVLFKLDYR